MAIINFENHHNEIIPRDDLTWGTAKPIIRYLTSVDEIIDEIQTLGNELRNSKIKSLYAIENGITYEEYYQRHVKEIEELLAQVAELANTKIIQKNS